MPMKITPQMRKNLKYIYDDDDDGTNQTEDIGEQPEFEFRHPKDLVHEDDPEFKNIIHHEFQAITTKAAIRILGISFVPPADISSPTATLRAFAPAQISIRIDDHRKLLMYDCFAWKPGCKDMTNDKELPTYKQMNAFDKCDPMSNMNNKRRHSWSFDDEEDSEDDEDDDEQVQLKEGATNEIKHLVHFKALAGEFFNTRLMRFRISISNIVGIRLHVPDPTKTAVLILELGSPPPTRAPSASSSTSSSSSSSAPSSTNQRGAAEEEEVAKDVGESSSFKY